MKITWFGHSCFKIEKDGYAIVVDPYTKGSVPGLAALDTEANKVYCTHEHGDHNGRNEVRIISSEIDNPFSVSEIDTYHDEVQGAKRGKNKIYIIDDGTNSVAHLGDLGCELTKEQINELTLHFGMEIQFHFIEYYIYMVIPNWFLFFPLFLALCFVNKTWVLPYGIKIG